ncbi:MAG: hypothetical protein ABTQ34_05690 [Bdellovibrionales bacterium]
MTERKPDLAPKAPATAKPLPPPLHRAAQLLWATYETLDLRIETACGSAEAAFLSALPELSDHREDMLHFIRHLLSGLRDSSGEKPEATQLLSLRLVYQDQNELIEQLIPGSRAQIVILPIDKAANLPANQ